MTPKRPQKTSNDPKRPQLTSNDLKRPQLKSKHVTNAHEHNSQRKRKSKNIQGGSLLQR